MPHLASGEEARIGDRVKFGSKRGTVQRILPDCQCSVLFDCTEDQHGFTLIAGTQLFRKTVNE